MSFLFSPIGIRLAICVAIALAVGVVLHLIRKDAAEEATRVIERANVEAERKANEGERNVLTCPPELWSRELRRCATNLH
jgi:hypothetical protein